MKCKMAVLGYLFILARLLLGVDMTRLSLARK
jgi:hypothetical protein